MRAPTPTLIRARAKAPLEDLEALHLSNAGVDCIKNLDACRRLRSLYADDNRLSSADGIAEIPTLWRIDLSVNQLRDITALTAFRALGFLHLEHNQLVLSQLACLRSMHIMELRLEGDPNILGDGGAEHTRLRRMKVVALLPNVWVLDGHYVSSMERELSIERQEAHVLASLPPSSDSNSTGSRHGGQRVVSAVSTTPNNAPPASALWSSSGSSTFGVAEQHANAAKMLDELRDEPERRLLHDLHRLRVIVSFHNEEAAVHNAHAQFAASKRAPNARHMPLVFLRDIQKLPRAERLVMAVLLTSFLQFHLDRALLVEALTLHLLESPAFPPQATDATGSLPPYAMTAIVSLLRLQAIEEEESMRQANLPEVTSLAFEDDCEVWRSLPPIVHTLLTGGGGDSTRDRGDPHQSEEVVASIESGCASVWCRRAVQLLSTASSFPDINESSRNKKRPASLSSIVALVHAASSSRSGNSIQASDFSEFGAVSFTVSVTPAKNWRRDYSPLSRPYPRPWASGGSAGRSLSESQSAPLLNQDTASDWSITSASAHRRPRPGEWVQVRPKQFLKILNLSADGAFVSVAPQSQPSNVLTLAVSLLTRVSGNAWRVAEDSRDEHLKAFLGSTNAKTSVSALVGKLHRDSEGFHRHGAARNQGFPNHDVQAQDVVASGGGGMLDGNKQPRAVGLFAASDTLDANYVLASPLAVAAQNFCASRTFTERNLPPAGLWQPIEHPTEVLVAAPSVVVGLQDLNPPSAKRTPTRRNLPVSSELTVPSEPAIPIEPADDLADLKRQLQAALGIAPPPDCASALLPAPSPRPDFLAASAIPRATSQPRLLPLRTPWHAVPTRVGLLVAPSPSPCPPSASSPSPSPSARVSGLSGSTRGVLKVREGNMPLPSLSSVSRQK